MGLNRRTLVKTFTAGAAAASMAGSLSSVSAQDKVKLVVLTHWGSQAYLDAFQAQIQGYTDANPNVEIEHQTVAFDELLSRITTSQLGGDAPDVAHIYNLWLPDFVNSQVFATPPEDVVADVSKGYAPGTIEGASYGDQVWGYPTEVNLWQLLYNKQMFADAGLEAPKTWDDFKTAAEKLTTGDVKGVVFLDGWDSAVVHPWTSLLWSNGGEYVSADHKEASFNSEQGAQTLQMQMDMIDAGHAMMGKLEDGDFINGGAAMIFMANFWGSDLRSGMTGGIENVGVAGIPVTGDNVSTAVQYEWLWAVSNASKQQEEAWKFLQWLNNPAAEGESSPMGNYLTSGLNAIPGRMTDQEAHADVVGDDFTGAFVTALATSRTEPIIAGGQEIKTVLQKQIEAAWHGQKSAQDALDEAADEVNRILSR